jgi:SnoaL-like domain
MHVMAKANYPIDPIEQVRRGKARYCRFVDTRQWDELAALFVPEPTIEMLDPDGNTIAAFSRREEFASVVRNFLDGARSSHHLHNAEIDIVSEREITAIWAMEDIVVNPAPRADQPARLHGYGHYHETWVHSAEGWRIARLQLRRTILEITPQ